MCGKPTALSDYQDLLLFTLKGLSRAVESLGGDASLSHVDFVVECLFSTITNANWSASYFEEKIAEGLKRRDAVLARQPAGAADEADCLTWSGGPDDFLQKAGEIGILSCADPDIRSLRELLITAVKGLAAYAQHAGVLGFRDERVERFFFQALDATTRDLTVEELVGWSLRAGEISVVAMALLDRANTETFGNPKASKVDLGVGSRPGILISGHDLRDLSELLEQSKEAGVDIYTHGEMLPAHFYPALNKYPHLRGNYGNAWWQQNQEFESFNGPIVMTTNCLVPVKTGNSYLERLYTTGVVRMDGAKHIPETDPDKAKDFSAVITHALTCPPPTALEEGFIAGGFAHHQVLSLAGEILEAVGSGAIKKFVVMAGCDGRHTSRSYYTEVAEALPKDTIILTAGCAKYRYNKLDLGEIAGLPRVLDAGQCNDSYSLVLVALKLKEALGLADINDLPIEYDIAWYEQKAVAVLLALLSLGVKGIRLGPTLPAFLSPNVARLLVETFDLKTISTAETDITEMLAA